MASLQELRGLFGHSDLNEKIEAAVIIGANSLLSASPTADQQRWAAATFENPQVEAKKAWMAVLASNSLLPTASIISATDGVIQTKVDAVIPTLVVAHAGV